MSKHLKKLAGSLKASYTELRRTGWALFIAFVAALFISRSGRELFVQQGGVFAWKLLLLGSAVAVSHLVRTQLFPYVDVEALLKDDSPHGGRVFLGICILSGAIILALCSGL